jgi:hypothetical protein
MRLQDPYRIEDQFSIAEMEIEAVERSISLLRVKEVIG